jgi:hypothetical protein
MLPVRDVANDVQDVSPYTTSGVRESLELGYFLRLLGRDIACPTGETTDEASILLFFQTP